MRSWKPLAAVMLAPVVYGQAAANDADVSIGGSPKLMAGHPTVRMARERVALRVGPAETRVTCDFWFTNDGPACTVRMGFPDEGNANEDIEPGKKPKSNFRSFKSWVDGRPTATALLAGAEEGAWHVKTVHFPARSTVHVRDRYVADIDSGIAGAGTDQGLCLMASYVVHTGRSWKGTIGRTEIAVTFDRRFARRRVRAVASSKLSKSGDGRALAKAPFPPAGTVLYAGVGKPTVRGRTLTFVRTNWRPKESDDLRLWFGFGHPVK